MEEVTEALINWKLLALEVIRQAMQDMIRPLASEVAGKAADQQSGYYFFFSPTCKEDLEYWCRLADLDTSYAVARASDIFRGRIDLAKVAADQARDELARFAFSGEVHEHDDDDSATIH